MQPRVFVLAISTALSFSSVAQAGPWSFEPKPVIEASIEGRCVRSIVGWSEADTTPMQSAMASTMASTEQRSGERSEHQQP
jgi:hypothetical protein